MHIIIVIKYDDCSKGKLYLINFIIIIIAVFCAQYFHTTYKITIGCVFTVFGTHLDSNMHKNKLFPQCLINKPKTIVDLPVK